MRLENSLKKAVLLLSALMLFIFSNAQVSIRLEQAIDSALHNNINFLANNLEIDYAKKMQKTNPDFDKTFIDFGFGQINGVQNDNRFGASQTFHFPTVYKKQASVNASAVQLAETNNLVDKEELIYRVKQQYYSLLVLNEQIVLLESADSIYASFYKQSKSRVDAGLSDALELSTVENQLMQIRQQLSIVRETKKGLLAKFQRTIQTTLHYTPNGDSIIYKFNFSPSLVGNTVSPKLLVLQSEESLLKKSTALEKSLLAPSFSVGYSSMTVKGWQTLSLTEDKYFGALDRFGSVNIGLFVPLFAHSQKARIAASEILVNQKKMETLSFKQELDDQYKITLSDFLIQKQILGEFMSKGLPGATLILQTASQKFKLGKISYLDWIGYTNQFIQTNADYLNAVMRYNEDVFELEKLNTQY